MTTLSTKLSELLAQIKEDVASSTKDVETELEVERIDSRLAHLLEAKKSLHAKLRTQNLNRNLRKKIAELNRHIEKHCRNLERQRWDEFCNSVDGQMRNEAK